MSVRDPGLVTVSRDVARRRPYVLRPNALAYIDSFGGLVKCRVRSVTPDGLVNVQVTATKAGYRRGEMVEGLRPELQVVHRDQVYVRNGQYHIRPGVIAVADKASAQQGEGT